MRLPIIDRTDCINVYKTYNLKLGQGQICAGGVKAKDSCLGDSGWTFFPFINVSIAHAK